MAGRKSDFTLPTLDDLFSSEEERQEQKLAKIRDIPIELIDDFPDHPFKVRDDEDMMQLVESIKERGVITPATVRAKEDGRYELVSGHRRKRACELSGMDTLRCEVVELTRDEATILMVESNFQRSQILPSEKAFAYKMRLEAMNRQGERTDLTSTPVVSKLRSNETLGNETGESREQIRRYVRLTNLVPELLEFVDEGRIKMRPAVELSYLDEDCQRDIVEEIDMSDATPSHDQTIRMRKFFEESDDTEHISCTKKADRTGITDAKGSGKLPTEPGGAMERDARKDLSETPATDVHSYTMNTPKTIELMREQMDDEGKAYFDSQIDAGGGVDGQRAHLRGVGHEYFMTSSADKKASGNFLTEESPGETPSERKENLQLPPENEASDVDKVVSKKPTIVLTSEVAPQEEWAAQSGYESRTG